MYMPGSKLWRRLMNLFALSGLDCYVTLPTTTGKIKFQRPGGSVGFIYFQESDSAVRIGSNLIVRNAADSANGSAFCATIDNDNYILCGDSARLGDDGFAFNPGIVVKSTAGITFASGAVTSSNNTSDAGFLRAAASVTKTSAGMSGNGWLQQTAARARLTGNQTTVSVTPANITDLTITLIAGRKYTGRIVLFFASATAADGFRLDFDGSAATMTSFSAMGWIVDTLGIRVLQPRTTAIATDFTDAVTTGDAIAVIEFAMVVNAAGTFIPRIAKSTDAAGATSTLYLNSHIFIEDVPA